MSGPFRLTFSRQWRPGWQLLIWITAPLAAAFFVVSTGISVPKPGQLSIPMANVTSQPDAVYAAFYAAFLFVFVGCFTLGRAFNIEGLTRTEKVVIMTAGSVLLMAVSSDSLAVVSHWIAASLLLSCCTFIAAVALSVGLQKD